MAERPEMPGFERIRADTGSFRRPDLWQQQPTQSPQADRADRRSLIYQMVLWPGIAAGAVLGSYLRQWAPPQPGLWITVASVVACAAGVQAAAWLVFAVVDRVRQTRRPKTAERFVVADIRRQPRHRREDATLVTAPTVAVMKEPAEPPTETRAR